MKMKNQNKIRKMKGVKPGRGSAGRVNAGVKKRKAQGAVMQQMTYFPDVAAACTDWLRSKGIKVGGFREQMLGEIHEAMAGKR